MDICSLGQSTVRPASIISMATTTVEADGLVSLNPAHGHSSPTNPTHPHSSPTPHAHQNIPLTTPSPTQSHASSTLPLSSLQVDLVGYKMELEQQMAAVWNRLSCMAWLSLSPQARVQVRNAIPRGKSTSYQHNRELLHRALSEANWPCPLQNFLILEEQISLAQSYLEWCEIHIRKQSSHPTLSPKLPHTVTTTPTPHANGSSLLSTISLPSGCLSHEAARGLKGQVVIARSDVDGLYYSSLVTDYVRTQHVSVQFADGRHQVTSTRHVFPVARKAASCHTPLQPGDCVLVGVGASTVGLHTIRHGTQVHYTPGIVESVELRSDTLQKAANCRVGTFGCHSAVRRPRRQLIKISHSCYAEACRSMVKVLGKRTQEGALNGRKRSKSWHGNGLLEHWKNVGDKERMEVGTLWSFRPIQDELSSDQVKEAFEKSVEGNDECVELKEANMKYILGVQQNARQSKVEQSCCDNGLELGSDGQQTPREKLPFRELTELKDQSNGPQEVQEGPQEEQKVLEGPQEEQKVLEGPQKEQKVLEGPQKEQKVQEGPQEEQKVLEGPQEEQDGPQDVQKGLVGKTLDSKVIDEVRNGPLLVKATSPPLLSLQSAEQGVNVSALEKQLGEGMQQVGTHLEQLEGQVAGLLTQQVKLDEILAKLVLRDEDIRVTMAGWKDAFLSSPEKEVPEVVVHSRTVTQAVMAVVEVCNQSVNTEPSKKDQGVGTDPMTESRGVETEWRDFVNSTPLCQQLMQDPNQGTACQTSHHMLPVMVKGDGGRRQVCGSCGMQGGVDWMVPVAMDSLGTNKNRKAKIRIRSTGRISGVQCGTRGCEVVPLEVHDKGTVLAGDVGSNHQVDKGEGEKWMRGTRMRGTRDGDKVNKIGTGNQTQMTGGNKVIITQKDGSSEEAVMVKGKDHDVGVVVEGTVIDDIGGGATTCGHGNTERIKDTVHFNACAPHVTKGEALTHVTRGHGNTERIKDTAHFKACAPHVAKGEALTRVSSSLAKATQNEPKDTIVAREAVPPGTAGQQADTCPGVVGPPSKLDAAEDNTTPLDSHRTQLSGCLAVGQTVLARWPDRGWYRCARVLRCEEEGSWYLLETEADTETIHCSDIVVPSSSSSFKVQDTVLSCYPGYNGCYVPAHVTEVGEQQVTVRLYDYTAVCSSKQDVYPLSVQKHQEVLRCIVEKEHSLVGKVVIARKDSDGLFYPGKVIKHMAFPQVYLIGWKNGSTQAQSGCHLFGPMTKRHMLREGDHVLGLASPSYGMCMPGQVVGSHKGQLEVEFCDGQKQLVDPTYCFKMMKKYFEAAVEYIALKAEDELGGQDSHQGH